MSSYYEKMLATGEVKCIDEEVPFEIPKGWEWCRLNEVATSVTDFVASGSFASLRENVKYYSTKEYALLVRTKDLSCNFSNDLVYTDKHGYDFLSNSNLFGGELILPNIGASIGKVFIVPNLNMPMTLAPNSVMIRLDDECTKSWLYNVFSSPFGYDTLWSISSSTAQGKFNKTDFRKVLIPIPPIEEQNRIVTKIKELSPYIEKYSKAQEHLDVWNVAIKEILQKSILQEAIQGKLVPQIAEEGTAQELLEHVKAEKQKLVKEGKLKKSALNDSVIFHGDDNRYYEKIGKKCVDITEEIPFSIPANWTWVRIRDVFRLNPKNEADDDSMAAFIPMEKISAGYKSDFVFDTVKWGSIKKGFTHFANGDVAFAKITPCFQNRKSAIFHGLPNGIGAGTTELKVLRPYGNTIGRWYLLYFLESPYFIDEATFKGTANQQRIVVGYLENKLFPLPPKEEQQRIVAQIEKLFEQLR